MRPAPWFWPFVAIASAADVDHWCPSAGCAETEYGPLAKCRPCSQRWLLVLATGRSGSTTLLNMINALNTVHLTGENRGQLEIASLLYNTAKSNGFDQIENTAFQHGPVIHTNLICHLQDWFLEVNPLRRGSVEYFRTHHKGGGVLFDGGHPTVVRGFKEVRVFSEQDRQMVELLFPCSRVIINYRKDIAKQLASGFWKSDYAGREEDAERVILNHTQALLDWHKAWGPTRSFLMPTEEFTLEKFEELRRWLGIASCKFTRVRGDNRSDVEPPPGVVYGPLGAKYKADFSKEPVTAGNCSIAFSGGLDVTR